MRTREFLSRLDHERIVRAIKEAEATTSGEIRVFIQRGEIRSDPLPLAQKKFKELGMTRTRARNGVLIFVAPRTQQFAVVGDEGVHQKCDQEFWSVLVAGMQAHFKNEDFTEALEQGIGAAGKLLARYFPRLSTDQNELPNTIIEAVPPASSAAETPFAATVGQNLPSFMAAVGMCAGFFMPWVTIMGFGVTGSTLGQIGQEGQTAWIIFGLAALSALSHLWNPTRPLNVIAGAAPLAALVYFSLPAQLGPELFQALGIGAWITLLCGVILIFAPVKPNQQSSSVSPPRS